MLGCVGLKAFTACDGDEPSSAWSGDDLLRLDFVAQEPILGGEEHCPAPRPLRRRAAPARHYVRKIRTYRAAPAGARPGVGLVSEAHLHELEVRQPASACRPGQARFSLPRLRHGALLPPRGEPALQPVEPPSRASTCPGSSTGDLRRAGVTPAPPAGRRALALARRRRAHLPPIGGMAAAPAAPGVALQAQRGPKVYDASPGTTPRPSCRERVAFVEGLGPGAFALRPRPSPTCIGTEALGCSTTLRPRRRASPAPSTCRWPRRSRIGSHRAGPRAVAVVVCAVGNHDRAAVFAEPEAFAGAAAGRAALWTRSRLTPASRPSSPGSSCIAWSTDASSYVPRETSPRAQRRRVSTATPAWPAASKLSETARGGSGRFRGTSTAAVVYEARGGPAARERVGWQSFIAAWARSTWSTGKGGAAARRRSLAAGVRWLLIAGGDGAEGA